ncbi:hypothetical protein AC249_AIPGENE9424 [Exaiptasia diaphana]|nr:hypothetical protein AC249_AIPGENE9424 [Exaiptasia diaphana]
MHSNLMNGFKRRMSKNEAAELINTKTNTDSRQGISKIHPQKKRLNVNHKKETIETSPCCIGQRKSKDNMGHPIPTGKIVYKWSKQDRHSCDGQRQQEVDPTRMTRMTSR